LARWEPGRDDDHAHRFGRDPAVGAMTYLAFTLWSLGEVDGASSVVARMRARIAEIDHVNSQVFGLRHAAMFDLMRGDATRVGPNALEAARLAREYDFKNETPAWAAFLQGWAADAAGAPGAGLAEMRRGVEELRAQNNLYFDALLKIALAGAEARAGDPGRAIAILDEAIGAIRDRGGQFEAELFRTRGEILLAQNHAAPAKQSLLAAIDVARRQKARSFELRAAITLAKLYKTTGRAIDGHDVLGPALAGFSPTPEFPEVAEAIALLAVAGAKARAEL